MASGSHERGLIWTTRPPTTRELRDSGYTVVEFRNIRAQHIEPVRRASSRRSTLENAAEGILRLLDNNPKLAVLGVPTRTAGDLHDIYAFLIEPAFRRDVSLLLGVDRDLDSLQPEDFVMPGWGYPWTLERLRHVADRYQRAERPDGLPPLTPIEGRLLDQLRGVGLTPMVQYGVGPYRLDFAFPAEQLAIEADGRAWHDAERDRARDQHLRRLGWETLRFSGSTIHRDPAAIVSQVRAALEARASIITYSNLPPVPERRRWWRVLLDWAQHRRRGMGTPAGVPAEQIAEWPTPRWKSDLDSDQREAVDAHEGVVQIIAPAGSGKTTTMIARVQELLSRGVPASGILCTTFNRATREEMEKRLLEKGVTGVTVKSFHALGWMILEEERRRRSEIGSISYSQWRRLAKQAMDAVPDGVWLDAPVASDLISAYKLAHMWDPETAARQATTAAERTAAIIYRLYEDHLAESDQHDFDDLILESVRLLQTDAGVRHRWQDRWESVLVDEYQDIEPAQELLIELVAAPEDSLFTVGDEDQCIYSWRRASVERIIMLDTVYPGLERVVLATSYRCPRNITEAARQLIANNRRRFPKQILPSPLADGDGLIEVMSAESLDAGARRVAHILEGEDPAGVVVLARTSRLLREVVQRCADAGVLVRAPERALQPSDAERTVLAYLRLASAPAGAQAEDVRQAFRVPNRYLPGGAEEAMVALLQGGASFRSAVQELPIGAGEDWRRPRIKEWAGLLSSLSAAGSAADAIRLLRAEGGVDRHYASVEQMKPHDQIEIETLSDLEDAARGSGIAEFVTRIEVRAALLAHSSDENGVELNTIHGAKGREWPLVILFAANADQLPHYRTLADAATTQAFEDAIEDERRLMYVAITRTKNRLVVITTDGKPSPFLREAGLAGMAAPMPTMESVATQRAANETPPNPSTGKRAKGAGRATGRPAGADRPTTVAKFHRMCRTCRRPVVPGQRIVKVGEVWIHEGCASA